MSTTRNVRAGVAIVLWWAAPALAQSPEWTVDVTAASYVEAWDFNEHTEHLAGLHAGIDRPVWRQVAVRGELVLLRVFQEGDDTWVRGGALLMRVRRGLSHGQFVADIGAGLATGDVPVPPGGTKFNYVLLAGAGVEVPWSRLHVTAGARWLHLSNKGREGDSRNPDIQSVGGFAGIGWRW